MSFESGPTSYYCDMCLKSVRFDNMTFTQQLAALRDLGWAVNIKSEFCICIDCTAAVISLYDRTTAPIKERIKLRDTHSEDGEL